MTREVIIPYGNESNVVKLDGIAESVVAYPRDSVGEISSDSVLESIEKPVGKPPLRDFLAKSKKLLIVVNDGTRRTATAEILELVHPYVERMDFKILIACGAHSKPKLDDLKRILGRNYARLSDKVTFHDSRQTEEMVYLGRSRRGTEFSINSLAIESDRILVITSVEPHYFAGFMGGRKSFLPGISSYATIVQNHRLALRSMARTFSLHRNPVNNDMTEIFRYLSRDKIFSIQLVQNRKGKITNVLSGDIQKTFFSLADSAKKLYGVKTGRRADILVTVVLDRELSLYESRKALNYGILGLKKGGILIVLSSCTKGLGHSEFFEPIFASPTAHHLIDWITKDFELGRQRLAKWAEATLWADIWLVSELPDGAVTDAFLKSYHSVDIAVKEAIKLKGASAKIAFVFAGTTTVPLPL